MIEPKILIVEDDSIMSKLCEFYLSTSGFDGKILLAHGRNDDVDKCLRYQPALVFINIFMPEKDGIVATREQRAGRVYKSDSCCISLC